MPIQETARLALKESDPSKSTDRSQSLWKVDPRDPRSFGYTPHSIAVNNGMYVHRPQTPTSPSSPGPSSQFYPAGSLNTTPPRHDSLDATRAFFSNLRAAQSGTIIPESSVHKFTQDSSSSIDGRKPGKTKSTPDFKAKYVDDPVPDLPLIDLDNQCKLAYFLPLSEVILIYT